jgi:hypothetical protein
VECVGEAAYMTTVLADECRKRAVECAEEAKRQRDPDLQRDYADLATIWRLVAQDAAENSVERV